MFFIIGMNQESRALAYIKTMICKRCGKYGRYQINMTYMVFTLFFIPLFKWDKKFFVKTSCCGMEYSLDKDIGKRILRGEDIEITEKDLSPIYSEHYSYHGKECFNCGYRTNENFSYCPKCGNRMDSF